MRLAFALSGIALAGFLAPGCGETATDAPVVVNEASQEGGTTGETQISSSNSVYEYLDNAEIQCECENDAQRKNIKKALNNALRLPSYALKATRYEDYKGKKEEWDIQTLFYKHIVPDKQFKTLGNNFYKEIKMEKVQKQIAEMLKKSP